jgi:hypothetical protein
VSEPVGAEPVSEVSLEDDGPLYDWAEVHYGGSLICEARWEEERWRLLAPPESFLEQLPMVVELKEMIVDRTFPAQIEEEFGLVYAREIPAPAP